MTAAAKLRERLIVEWAGSELWKRRLAEQLDAYARAVWDEAIEAAAESLDVAGRPFNAAAVRALKKDPGHE